MSLDIDKPLLRKDDDDLSGRERLVRLKKLHFPWPLIHVAGKLFAIGQSDSNITMQLLFSFRFPLLINSTIYMLCIIFGAIFLDNYSYSRMLPIFLIVQGSCGFFVVMIYVGATICGYENILYSIR